MKVDLINVNDATEALALRSVLEFWGFTVALHPIATAQQLVRVLGGQITVSQTVVLLCHGSAQGIELPALAHELAAVQPYGPTINAAQLREFLHLPGRLVLNTGCLLGKTEFAGAFIDSGCRAYIGAADFPEASASLAFTLNFFYEWGVKRRDVESAHREAAVRDAQTALFRLFLSAL